MVAQEFWIEAICTEVVSVIFLILLLYGIAASRFLPPHKLARSQLRLTYLALATTLFQCLHSIDIEGAMGIWSAALSHSFQQQITAMLLLTVAVRINATSSALYALLQKAKPTFLAPLTFGVVLAYYAVITSLSIVEIYYERTYRPVSDMFQAVYGRAIAFIIVGILIQLSTIILYLELRTSMRSFIRQLKEKERRDRLTTQLMRLHAVAAAGDAHPANAQQPQPKPVERVPISPSTEDGMHSAVIPPRPAAMLTSSPAQPVQVWQVNVNGISGDVNGIATGLTTRSGEINAMAATPMSPDDATAVVSQWTARAPIDREEIIPESPIDSVEDQPRLPSALSLRIKELQVGLKKLLVFTIVIDVICLIGELASIDYFRADPNNPGDSYKLQQYDHYPATYALYPLCQCGAILLAIYQVWIHPRLLRDLNLPFWHTIWHGVQDPASLNRMEQKHLVLDGIEIVEPPATPFPPQRQQVQQQPVLPIRAKPVPVLQPKALDLKKQWEMLDLSSIAPYESAGTTAELPSFQPIATADAQELLEKHGHHPRPSVSPSPFLLLPRLQTNALRLNNPHTAIPVALDTDEYKDRRSIDKVLTAAESGSNSVGQGSNQGGKTSAKSSARKSQPSAAPEKHSESSTSDRPSQLPGVMKSQVAAESLAPISLNDTRFDHLPTSGVQEMASALSYDFDGSQNLMSANHRSPHVVGRFDSVIMVDEGAGDDDEDEDDIITAPPDHMGPSGTLSLVVSDAAQAIDRNQHRVVMHPPHAE